MPLGSGMGWGQYGEDPYGQTNFARKILLENIPPFYLSADKDEDFVFTKFIQSMYPHTNEFRRKLDTFPNIRDAESVPPDSILTQLFIQRLNSVAVVTSSVLPVVVPGQLLVIVGSNPAETLTVSVIEVQNTLSRIKIGTPWPYASGVRSSVVRNVEFLFRVTAGSDFITSVPTVFPDIKPGDFIKLGDIRHSVSRIDPQLFEVEFFPPPEVPSPDTYTASPGINTLDGDIVSVDDGVNPTVVFEFDKNGVVTDGRYQVIINDLMTASDVAYALQAAINHVDNELYAQAEISGATLSLLVNAPVTRQSRLLLLTLLGKDIGVVDDSTKVENIRRGIVLHSPELFRMKGTSKSYTVRGALDGLDTTVSNFKDVPCSTFNQVEGATGTITTVIGNLIAEAEFVTVPDGILAPITFEFDKDGTVTPGNVKVTITNTMNAETTAAALADAINDSVSSVQAHAIGSKVVLMNAAAGSGGILPLVDGVADPGFVVAGMSVGTPWKETPGIPLLTPHLYMASMDNTPADISSMDNATASKYLDSGVPASGRITVVAGSSILDGETFTLNDGINTPIVFEFDKDSVITSGRVAVPVTNAMTASDVASAVRSSVNSTFASLQVTATADAGVVFLRNNAPGTFGNKLITKTVVNLGFTVVGMTGGLEGANQIVPVRFPDLGVSFNIVGVRFTYNPGPAANQVTLTSEAELSSGDVVEFGSQQRIVAGVSGISPYPQIPGFRAAGAVVTFDASLVGLSPGGVAVRVTRQPAFSAYSSYLTVNSYDYRVLFWDSSQFSGRSDIPLREVAMLNTVVVGIRRTLRSMTRQPAFNIPRIAVLKPYISAIPDSYFSGGTEEAQLLIRTLDEVQPIHVEFDSLSFTMSGYFDPPLVDVTVETP